MRRVRKTPAPGRARRVWRLTVLSNWGEQIHVEEILPDVGVITETEI